jgi:hypothetical protein
MGEGVRLACVYGSLVNYVSINSLSLRLVSSFTKLT